MHPNQYHLHNRPVQNADPPEEILGVPITWAPLSSYCGTLPPEDMTDVHAMINWLGQKTSKSPTSPGRSKWENVIRVLERTAMVQLQTELLLARKRALRL